MCKSNFRNLISELQGEIQHQANENTLGKCLSRLDKSKASRDFSMKNLIKSSHAINKSLAPTKTEVKKANQKKMQGIRKSIKNAILNKSMTSIEIIKAENVANNLQAKLYQRGLI